MSDTRRPRSAEQTARLLLSNAFRYDTWECSAAKKEVLRSGGAPTTVQITFNPVEKQDLPVSGLPPNGRVDAFNLSIFDPEQKAFVGAAYRCERRLLHDPLVFQATPKQIVVMELLTRDTRASAPLEGMRATHWGSATVASLGQPGLFSLRPGNAHLLLLEQALWPAESLPSTTAAGTISYKCKTNRDAALSELMTELVPPGVFVPESFTKATPQQGGKSFRLVVSSIELSGTSKESMTALKDENSDWAVAAVAHNGYQQLGQGAEVPLAVDSDDEDADHSGRSSYPYSKSYSDSYSDSSYGYSYDSSRSSDDAKGTQKGKHNAKQSGKVPPAKDGKASKDKGAKSHTFVLRSELPLEMDGLPVHSATSLVLAIRRRTPESKGFKVMGFCVFPLCVMPMQNRDVRVENLPALRGPFSCEDARMLMVDSSSPYGRVPIAMTVTMEYHDLQVPPSASAAGNANAVATPPAADTLTAIPPTPPGGKAAGDSMGSSLVTSHSSRSSLDREGRASRPASTKLPDGAATSQAAAVGMTVLSTADGMPSPAVDATSGASPSSPHEQRHPLQPSGEAATTPTGAAAPLGSDGIFRLLCTIMEELQKVREAQDVILRQTSPSGAGGRQQMSPALQDRLGQKLADGPIDLIDLAPRPLAVSWKARRAITENVQPIVHPTKGTLLDENTPAPPGSLPVSLFGIRFEGATLDAAIAMPDDVCVMFSFGPLPYQQVGPMNVSSVEKPEDGVTESFKFYDSDNRGGLVWCEPTESLTSVAMAKFKECGGNSTIYIHLYDALTMFYVATASVPLSLFHRPFNAEAAVAPMDLLLHRDFSLTEQLIPPKIFPVMRHAGQLHVSLFCVGVAGGGPGGAPVKSAVMREPEGGVVGVNGCCGGVIVAKRLPQSDRLVALDSRRDGESPQAPSPPPRSTNAAAAADGSVDSPRNSPTSPVLQQAEQGQGQGVQPPLHWQRADFIKRQLAAHRAGSPLMPGVPDAHVRAAQEEADMEFKLRYAEKERSEAKAKAIAAALASRMTVVHQVQAVAWRPEMVRTPFQNPHSVPMQFQVEIPSTDDKELCTVVGGKASFFLGPRERTEVAMAVRMFPSKDRVKVGDTRVVKARIYSERREVMRYIEVQVTLAPPLVDRRYEIFGPAGSTVSKRIFSRLFSSSSFPITSNQGELLKRMRDLCAYAATSNRSGRSSVETNAVLDPITQTYVTAWEEATVNTTIPTEMGKQRTEYVTFFYDADMTRVYETWELSIFPCECLTTREIAWGQTTALGLPAAGTEELYCDQRSVAVENTGASYVLRLRPKETGPQRMLLHTLRDDGILSKTIMTVPVAYPTPSFSQVIELSLAEVAAGPIFRRLTFKHRGDVEEVFQMHHNYKYQLRLSPMRFALAPNDTQFISLQFDSLVLPPGQMEGRWPMWIFINNAQDKTVESYYLQVVLRAHPIVTPPDH